MPWVADGALSTLGVGNVEVLPRHVLIVYDSREAPGMHYRAPHRFVEMLLNYFGYVADYVDADGILPEPDHGRYAGIVSWFDGDLPEQAGARYARWLRQRIGEGWRLAMFSRLGFVPDKETLAALELAQSPLPVGNLSIAERSRDIGYEGEPLPRRSALVPLIAPAGRRKRHELGSVCVMRASRCTMASG